MSTVRKGTAREAVDRISNLSRLRWKVQLFFLIALNALWVKDWRGARAGVCFPVLNCHGCPVATTHCPIGVIGEMLHLRLIPWIALGGFGIIGTVLGRATCGWVCPFGFLQDILAKIPVRKWNPPRWVNWIKYVVLAGMVFLVASLVGVDTRWFFCRICPAATLSGSIPLWIAGDLTFEMIQVKLFFLVGFLALMIFVERGFCRVACPIGAGLALFNRFSFLSVKLRGRWCSECMQCARQCPSKGGPVADPRDPECMYCMECFKCTDLKMNFRDEGKEL